MPSSCLGISHHLLASHAWSPDEGRFCTFFFVFGFWNLDWRTAFFDRMLRPEGVLLKPMGSNLERAGGKGFSLARVMVLPERGSGDGDHEPRAKSEKFAVPR